MAKKQQETITRSVRILSDVANALDQFASDQLMSGNAAINRILKERLTEYGYLESNSPHPKQQS
jgi:hypothetical protein